jgi:hypothetical protein
MYGDGLLIYRFVGELAVLCVAIVRHQDFWQLPNTPALNGIFLL